MTMPEVFFEQISIHKNMGGLTHLGVGVIQQGGSGKAYVAVAGVKDNESPKGWCYLELMDARRLLKTLDAAIKMAESWMKDPR